MRRHGVYYNVKMAIRNINVINDFTDEETEEHLDVIKFHIDSSSTSSFLGMIYYYFFNELRTLSEQYAVHKNLIRSESINLTDILNVLNQ